MQYPSGGLKSIVTKFKEVFNTAFHQKIITEIFSIRKTPT